MAGGVPARLTRGAAREWTLRLLMVGVSLLVALALAEVVLRAFYPIYDGRDNLTLDGRPIDDWFEPGTVYRQVSNEYDARTTITGKAHRVPGVEGAANPEVIFLGDSFTYGYGLADEETFAAIYCAERRLACANLGYPGSGTSRQVRRLEEFLDAWGWKPREVKLFFFGMSTSFSAGNDFVDNYNFGKWLESQPPGTRAPSTLKAPGAAAQVRGSSPAAQRDRPREESSRGLAERLIGLQGALVEHSTLMRRVKFHWGPLLKSVIVADPGDRMAESLKYTAQGLNELDALSRRAGFDYTIYLIVPVQDILRGTHAETLAALNRVSPRPALPTGDLFAGSPADFYFAYDGHLNPKGSRRVAELLISRDARSVDRARASLKP